MEYEKLCNLNRMYVLMVCLANEMKLKIHIDFCSLFSDYMKVTVA
jgi:hypothetical protein